MLIETAAWLWEKFGKEVSKRAIGETKKVWERIQWKGLEAAYRERLYEEYSVTKLLGNPKPIRLDAIYTDAYVLDQVSAYQRMSVRELEREAREHEDDWGADSESQRGRISLKDLIQKEQRLYVLGKPGAGKSTFLKHVTLLCCKGEIQKTPVFVSLKAWADLNISLMDFIDREFKICDFPNPRAFVETLLKSGSAVVLFDGLDEVSDEKDQRGKTIKVLTEFAREFHKVQIVVTCRVAATDYSFEKFRYVEVADFTRDQQDQFVDKWYAHDPGQLSQFRSEWEHAENRGLRLLGRTPLLLALLCLAFDETLSFPKRRVEIYQEALNALLKKWDSSRGILRDSAYRRLSLVRKEQLLSRIASETFQSSEFFIPKAKLERMVVAYLNTLPPDEMEVTVNARDVIQAIEVQHGVLVERAQGIYSFSHLTFHEYYTAKSIVENVGLEESRSVARERGFNDQWREVFLLVASLIDNGDAFLSQYLTAIRKLVIKESGICKLLRGVEKAAESSSGWRGRDFGWVTESGLYVTGGSRKAKVVPGWPVILDALLGLAVELTNSGLVEKSKALWRARYLATMIQRNVREVKEILGSSNEAVEIFAAYVKASKLFVECMNVASVKDRALYEKQLLVAPK